METTNCEQERNEKMEAVEYIKKSSDSLFFDNYNAERKLSNLREELEKEKKLRKQLQKEYYKLRSNFKRVISKISILESEIYLMCNRNNDNDEVVS
jgi:hypothetical protein